MSPTPTPRLLCGCCWCILRGCCSRNPDPQLVVPLLEQQPRPPTPTSLCGCFCNSLRGCCRINLCACLRPDPHLAVRLLLEHPAQMLQQQPGTPTPTPSLLCGCWSSNLYLRLPFSFAAAATSTGDPDPDPQLVVRLHLAGPTDRASHLLQACRVATCGDIRVIRAGCA